jgi:hypothetical protein
MSNIIINVYQGQHGKCRHRAAGFDISFGLPTSKDPVPIMTTKTITNEQKVTVTLAPVTDTGKPAKLDGAPAWTVVSGNSQVVVAEDGLSASLVSSDDPGDTEIVIKADADLGAGVEEITETIVLTVTSATAKNFGIAFGTPEPK